MRSFQLALALLAFASGACLRANEPPEKNLVDVLEEVGRFTTLLQIVSQDAAERFLDFMTPDRRLTLFAPPDEALTPSQPESYKPFSTMGAGLRTCSPITWRNRRSN